jgi:hypothetical protein
MVLAGYAVEIIFGATGLVPATRNADVFDASITWNYTTFLNIIFLTIAGCLLWRFFQTGGVAMLKMMGGSAEHAEAHNHGHGHGHGHG